MLLHQDSQPGFPPRKRSARSSVPYAVGVDTLVDALYALQEPWRSRFLALVHYWQTGTECDGHPPGSDQVREWLVEDDALRSSMRQLLETWTHLRV